MEYHKRVIEIKGLMILEIKVNLQLLFIDSSINESE